MSFFYFESALAHALIHSLDTAAGLDPANLQEMNLGLEWVSIHLPGIRVFLCVLETYYKLADTAPVSLQIYKDHKL